MNRSALPLVWGTIEAGSLVVGADLVDRGVELDLVVGAVVGQDALDPDPEPAQLGGRDLEGRDRAGRRFVGDRHDDRVAAGVVDDDLDVVVADAPVMGLSSSTSNPV